MTLPEASQDWSKANSTAAGVVRDEAAVAVVIFLRYYYRRNNAISPYFHERRPARGTECPAGTPRTALPRTQTRTRSTRALLQGDGTEADDEVRQSRLCLPLRP